jgi:hypothetical protein
VSGKIEPGWGNGKGAGVDEGQHGTGVESPGGGCKGHGAADLVPVGIVQA